MWTALPQTQLKPKTQQLSQQWCLEETTPGVGSLRQSSTCLPWALEGQPAKSASQYRVKSQKQALSGCLPALGQASRKTKQLETRVPFSHTPPADLSVALTMVCVGVTPGDHVLSPLFFSSDSMKPGPLPSQEPWSRPFPSPP